MSNDNETAKPYMRKRGVVMAMQLNHSGEYETDAGMFRYKAGDWSIRSDSKLWICEEEEFHNLYEPLDFDPHLQQ